MAINKKIVLDQRGKPSEVIIPYSEYQKIERLLGLDLTEAEKASIEDAKSFRAKNDFSCYRKEDKF